MTVVQGKSERKGFLEKSGSKQWIKGIGMVIGGGRSCEGKVAEGIS